MLLTLCITVRGSNKDKKKSANVTSDHIDKVYGFQLTKAAYCKSLGPGSENTPCARFIKLLLCAAIDWDTMRA